MQSNSNSSEQVGFNTWKQGMSAGPMYTGWNQGDTICNVLNTAECYTLSANGQLNSLWSALK